MDDVPQLLRVPEKFRTVDDVLATAGKLGLSNVLVLSQREDGSLVFLETDMSFAEANWLLDRMKMLLLAPALFERRD